MLRRELERQTFWVMLELSRQEAEILMEIEEVRVRIAGQEIDRDNMRIETLARCNAGRTGSTFKVNADRIASPWIEHTPARPDDV